jgi:hypothetical protein
MNDEMAEIEIEDTRAQRAKLVEDRLRRLREGLEVNGRLNTALARAAGIDAFDVPAELLREIEEVEARVGKAGPLSRADVRRMAGSHPEKEKSALHGEPPSASTD